MTNYHVVEGCKDKSKIVYQSNEVKVKLKAKDKYLDLALLKADIENEHYIVISNKSPKKLQRIIAAGYPLEVFEDNEYITVPLQYIHRNNFALRVNGDSMRDDGILDKDIIIVKKTDTADNGQIVVALIDDHEAMLKRIRRKGKTVALESANKNYETKIFGPDRVKVQGVLVSLYRNF